MNIRTLCGVMVMGGLMVVAAPSSVSLAQSNDAGASAGKDGGASAPRSAAPSNVMTPTKHRYWRHRGGRHPHYGSRRVRSQ